MFEVLLGIIAALIIGCLWTQAEKTFGYPVLGRIYKRLSDDGKIYALYLYDAVVYITAGLVLFVIVLAIAYTFLVENQSPGVYDIIIVVAAFVTCALTEVPIVGRIFKLNVSMDYIAWLILTGLALLGLWMTLNLVLIPGLILFLIGAYGSFSYLNNMIKIVSREKMKETDRKIGNVVEKWILVAVGLAYGTDETAATDDAATDPLFKTKVTCRLVFDIVSAIVVAAFYISFIAVFLTFYMVVITTVVCLPTLIILGRRIWKNAKALH